MNSKKTTLSPHGIRQLILGLSFLLFQAGIVPVSCAATEEQPKITEQTDIAIFSAGCFWCAEEIFAHLDGVTDVSVGFTGGKLADPSYVQVSTETTGHQESVKVSYNPTKISYDKLLDAYWHNIDPFDAKGQFCDKGDSYKAYIFYRTPAQQAAAEASRKKYESILKASIVTQIKPAATFYLAEDYHQHYASRNPIRYTYYRHRCGRDNRLNEIWHNQK